MATGTSRRALWLQKIADEVVVQLRRKIAEGELTAGQSPGARNALASEFVTATSVIDRALEQLVESGVLIVEGGQHVVAEVQPPAERFAVSPGETPRDVEAILELRLGLEAVSAALAAERRNTAQLAAITSAASDFAATTHNGRGIAQADIRFHREIASASGNTYLRELLDYLGPLLMPRMRMLLPHATDAEEDQNLAQSIDEHGAIVSAIASQQPDEAHRAMSRHLMRTISLVKTASAVGKRP